MSEELDLGLLAESFTEMLGAEWPREKAVAFATAGRAFDDDLWAQMAGLGWTALTVPEADSGLGLSSDAAVALHAALGAVAAPVPMLGTTLAVTLLRVAGNDAQRAAWLPGLANGSLRVAFAEPGANALGVVNNRASGTAPDVLDAGSASLLFLRADRAGQAGWIAVEADAAGVAIEPIALADTSRTLGALSLHEVALADDRFFASSPAGDDQILRIACIAIAADAVGGGEAALAGTIEYMNVREQFGRVIGSFQALKHRVADHQAALVAARGLVEHAASLSTDDPQGLLAALTAKQHVTRAVAEIARDCIQLHGGVGFTSEFFPHVYLKRAKLNEALFGTRAVLLDRVADLLEAA